MAKKKTPTPPSHSPPEPRGPDGRLSVLLELRGTAGASGAFARTVAEQFDLDAFNLDAEFQPVPLDGREGFAGSTTYLLRGTVADEGDVETLRAHPDVARVWPDVPIAPFAAKADASASMAVVDLQQTPAAGACPIPPCDCSPLTAKGTLADVAASLQVPDIWAAGVRGTGIVVGVVDSGLTAQGRPVQAGQTTRRIDRVIGGWPAATWGTRSVWGEHGNMSATAVLGMAPGAQLYDLRVGGTGSSVATISRAIQAFQWAIDRHRIDGTPHVLTNSWGIYQEAWATTYARDPNHPFTRKVVEAINQGILVLFAAGNCGDTCPDGRCGTDTGPGRSIWGANGHPNVMTVGAVNRDEHFIGYSSQGPAALHADKPDFCGISHYRGYYPQADNGTSAACPIAAGVVALLKQAKPSLTQAAAQTALKATAKDIGPGGFDRHSGAGILRPLAAYRRVTAPILKDPRRDPRRTDPRRDLFKDPRLDGIGTFPRGDVFTDPRRDLFKIPRLDGITGGVRDIGGTASRIDPIKTPRLDTLDEGIKPPGEGIPDPIRPPIRGRRPFVLQTPHRAPNWRDVEALDAPADDAEALMDEIDRVAAYYRHLVDLAHETSWSDDDLSSELYDD